MKKNELRIIAGKWKGRKINFPDIPDLRPTPDRVRETLFNWLMKDIVGARCLDLFAGSGALSFEALSRGAKQVVAFEKNLLALQTLEENKKKLSANNLDLYQDNEAILRTSVALAASPSSPLSLSSTTTALTPPVISGLQTKTSILNEMFDIIFLDPPFKDDLHKEYLQKILEKKLLTSRGLIYLESPEAFESLKLAEENLKIYKSSKAGHIHFYLLMKIELESRPDK